MSTSLAAVVAALASLGIPAHEERSHVSIPLPDGRALALGTVNGPWQLDLCGADGDTLANLPGSLPADSAPQAVAEWVNRSLRLASGPLFVCTCTWAEGSSLMPLAELVENAYEESTRAQLLAAKVGEAVTAEEPFNGTETFTRIA